MPVRRSVGTYPTRRYRCRPHENPGNRRKSARLPDGGRNQWPRTSILTVMPWWWRR